MQNGFSLPKQTVRLWQIRIGIIAIVLIAPFAFFIRKSQFFLLILVITVALLLFEVFLIIPFAIKKYRISIDENYIKVSSGIIINTENLIPRKRIASVTGFQTPLAKRMKLAATFIKSARKRIFIPELAEDTAKIFFDSGKTGDDI